jgi:hypothetical protein
MADTDATEGTLAAPTKDNSEAAPKQNQSQPASSAAAADWVTDDVREVVKAKGWKSPSDAIKSYVELEKYSSKSVQDMTPEEREKFYKRIGRPDSSDAYELSGVLLPKGVEQTPDSDKAYREVCHLHGLTKEQAKGIHEWASKASVDAIIAMNQAFTKKKKEAEESLRKEWGTDYEGNLKSVQLLIKNFGDNDIVKFLNTGPGNEPAMLRFLHRLKGTMTEDTLVEGKLAPREPTTEPGGFDWSKVPSVSGENRYGHR